MKFLMNGLLIIGKINGQNFEITEDFGELNMFIFGEKADGVNKINKLLHEGK